MYRNIALDKPCTQSSSSAWEEECGSFSAVSGILTGGFSVHTELEQDPWWQVDLEQVEPIHGVVVWNRDDATAARACPLHISTSLDGEEWVPLCTTHFVFGGIRTNAPLRLTLAQPIKARYIRLTVLGEQILHLDQVEILQKEPIRSYSQLIKDKQVWNKGDVDALGVFFSEGTPAEIYPVFWEGLPFPIYLRRGTSDWANFSQIFVSEDYDLPLTHAVEQVVDLGSYIGLSAVYFANRYPEARIVCLEPSRDNFQLLQLNTRCYRQIECRNAAIWSHACTLSLLTQTGGDWGNQFGEDRDGEVPALGLQDVITLHALSRLDLLKVDIEGAEKQLFEANFERFVPMIGAITCELHDHFVPGCSDAYVRLFRQNEFREEQSGEYQCFIRHSGTDHE